MRVKFIPMLFIDFTDIEAMELYDQGFEVKMDFRPMIGDQLNLFDLLDAKQLKNPELHDSIMDMEDSVVTSVHIEKDDKGILLAICLDEEDNEDMFGFFSSQSDKSELN